MSQAPAATPPIPLLRRGWLMVRTLLARGSRWVRRAVERLLHPLRRQHARAQLTRLLPVRSVAVLCYGNICRSPYAAERLGQGLARRGLDCRVTQGGFFGPDRPANDRAREVALGRGTDLSGHRSRLFTAEEARTVDLVVVMEGQQGRRVEARLGASPARVLVLGDLDPEPIESRAIPDPYGHDVEFFIRTYDRIDRCVAELERQLAPVGPDPGRR
jgi:protein-tyrosine-phosphatase